MKGLTVAAAMAALYPVAALAWDESAFAQLRTTNNCESCDLSGSDLKRLDLTGANLSGSNLSGAKLWGAELGPPCQ